MPQLHTGGDVIAQGATPGRVLLHHQLSAKKVRKIEQCLSVE